MQIDNAIMQVYVVTMRRRLIEATGKMKRKKRGSKDNNKKQLAILGEIHTPPVNDSCGICQQGEYGFQIH